jgi:hypothetical protein
MRVKLSQVGECGGCRPTPFHYIYHHQPSCSVRSSWVGRHTNPVSSLGKYVLCAPTESHLWVWVWPCAESICQTFCFWGLGLGGDGVVGGGSKDGSTPWGGGSARLHILWPKNNHLTEIYWLHWRALYKSAVYMWYTNFDTYFNIASAPQLQNTPVLEFFNNLWGPGTK